MDYPLAYYERRNAGIAIAYQAGASIGDIADRWKLGKRRVVQILRDLRVYREKRRRLPVVSIMKECKLTPYSVRGALLRAFGAWPYPISSQP